MPKRSKRNADEKATQSFKIKALSGWADFCRLFQRIKYANKNDYWISWSFKPFPRPRDSTRLPFKNSQVHLLFNRKEFSIGFFSRYSINALRCIYNIRSNKMSASTNLSSIYHWSIVTSFMQRRLSGFSVDSGMQQCLNSFRLVYSTKYWHLHGSLPQWWY